MGPWTGRRTRRHPFNMIEVVLGLGLIAFGLVSTLGLFPVGLNASRDSIAESYAADSADQFLHFLATRLKDPGAGNDFPNWDTYGKTLPTTKPSATDPTTWSNWFSDATTTFLYAGASKEFYKVEQRAAGATHADFSAIYRVWRESVTYSAYIGGVWQEITASDDAALGINIEVSWPSNIPYASRQKSLYHIEVYKPQ